MSKYKSFSVHAGICGCKKVIASTVAAITAAALPLTILGVGTVGAILFRISNLSAHSMMPSAEPSSAVQEREAQPSSKQPEEETPVSSE